MDLIDEPLPGRNVPEFTVSDIAGTVKRLIEGELGYVRVKGEVGRVVLARSGHLYFDMKDDKNVLSCMTWKGQREGLEIMPEEGMEVVVEGKMTASGFKSQYAMNVVRVQVAGEGALMAMLEKRKKALQAEGLFEPSRKKPLPFLPDVIGVVTSPQGAVIRDILHRLRDRFPRKVLVWPVAVQGKECAPQVAHAIAGFNALTPGGALPRPDLIIVARGGGSIEDLWGFNEEIVARAAAASDIPLISAVGHETDTTLIDFVSDRRAPTPTAAAEMAVPVRLDLAAFVDQMGARSSRALSDGVSRRRQRTADLGRLLGDPARLTEDARARLDYWTERLDSALQSRVQRGRLRLQEAGGVLRPALLGRQLAASRTQLDNWQARLAPALTRGIAQHRRDLTRASTRLTPAAVTRASDRGARDLSTLLQRLATTATRDMERRRARLDALERMRETLGYEETLKRGYAVVWADGAVATGTRAVEQAAIVEVQLADGRTTLRDGAAPTAPKKPAPKPRATPGDDQGSLF